MRIIIWLNFFTWISFLIYSHLAQADVQVVPNVDLAKYAGRWYEIASIPQFFQRKCVSDVSAEYTVLGDNVVKVVNQCRRSDGTMNSAEGRARVVDAKTPAKLEVTFVHLFDWVYTFGGDYWIVDLAPDYHFAVVGHPARKYAWILSRTPTLDAAELKQIEARLKAQGYDTCQVLTTVQRGGPSARGPLCGTEGRTR